MYGQTSMRLGIALAFLGALVAFTAASAVAVTPRQSSVPEATFAKTCVVKVQSPVTGRIVTVYTLVKKKRAGKTFRVKVPKRAACSKTTLCTVTAKTKNGKRVPVYLTRLIKTRVKGKTVKKRVFVYQVVKKGGKKVKTKVPKKTHAACAKKKAPAANSGVPVTITVDDPSVAHLDFGGFQRDIPLSGTLKGFIVGTGFQLGQDNQIQLTSGRISLAPTGIFIDDACKGRVTDSIRTDPNSFVEIDPGSNKNAVTVAANSSITGLLHMHVQTALDMRNDDNGCDDPYVTTGWTDFNIPLFVKGSLTATQKGLTSTLSIGETVLNDLSACLAPGDPTLVCNGFAIPFPAILTSKIVAIVKVGS